MTTGTAEEAQYSRYFGLHIARTAGTSIADAAIRHFGRHNCLVVSSFTQAVLDNQILPQEQELDPPPLFAFGHYVHECLLGLMLARGPVRSFCVIRDPRDRLQSAVDHLKSLGVAEEAIHDHLSPFPDPLCTEILRCFPSATRLLPRGTRAEQALLALSTLDDVVRLEDIEELSAGLLAQWGAPRDTALPRLNARPEVAAGHERAAEALFPDGFLANDLELWSRYCAGGWRHQDRGVLLSVLRGYGATVDRTVRRFHRHLGHFMQQEFDVLGTGPAELRRLRSRLKVMRMLEREMSAYYEPRAAGS